jgi:hypothetical protein
VNVEQRHAVPEEREALVVESLPFTRPNIGNASAPSSSPSTTAPPLHAGLLAQQREEVCVHRHVGDDEPESGAPAGHRMDGPDDEARLPPRFCGHDGAGEAGGPTQAGMASGGGSGPQGPCATPGGAPGAVGTNATENRGYRRLPIRCTRSMVSRAAAGTRAISLAPASAISATRLTTSEKPLRNM